MIVVSSGALRTLNILKTLGLLESGNDAEDCWGYCSCWGH